MSQADTDQDPQVAEFVRNTIDAISRRAGVTPAEARARLIAVHPQSRLSLYLEGLSAEEAAERFA